MPTMYIIAGCNGAGKTTASNTILPDILNCREFVNADNIAAGLSPFEAEKYAIEAGRLMLKRIDQLITEKVDFAIETTLSSKNYLAKIDKVKENGFRIILLFFWLNNEFLAIRRVKSRVSKGGHNIPNETIRRRYARGLRNFFQLYISMADYWSFFDNSKGLVEIVAEGEGAIKLETKNEKVWKSVLKRYGRKMF